MSLNDVTVKEELAQLNDIFKLIEDINQKKIELDDKDIDEKMFSFKRKVCNWLNEGDEMQKREKRKTKSLCSKFTVHHPYHQVSNH